MKHICVFLSALLTCAVSFAETANCIPTCISSHPFITGATFRLNCKYIVDDETQNLVASEVQDGDVIFLARNWVERFFNEYRPHIKHNFILLTHHYVGECDLPVPGPYAHYLDDEQLYSWFTINVDRTHPKLKPLPIGIGNAFYPCGNVTDFYISMPKFYHAPRTKLLYMNFNINTYPDERAYVYTLFAKKSFCTTAWNNRSHEQYLRDIGEHKFVLSPRGYGIDCFRTWEALLMGSIPIVHTSFLDPLFENLPVLIVNNWEKISEEFLEKKYEEIRQKMRTYHEQLELLPSTFNKLYIPYWLNEINAYAQLCKRIADLKTISTTKIPISRSIDNSSFANVLKNFTELSDTN